MPFWEVIKEVSLCVLDGLLYFFSRFVRKDKNIWIFGALFGGKYMGNSKYLFEYVNRNYPDIRAIWMTRNKQVLELVRSKGYEAYPAYSLKGCWLSMKSKVGVVSHSKIRDLRPFVMTRKARLVQLWHGIPLKKTGFDDTLFAFKKLLLFRAGFAVLSFICPSFRRRYDLVAATSEENREKFKTAFNVYWDRIKITGYPCNDALFAEKTEETDTGTVEGVYAPTFRGKEGSEFDLLGEYGFDVKKIEDFLEKKNIRLYLKLHPFNFSPPHLLEQIEASKHIMFFKEDDIYGSLNRFSFLITDYSSIYFDFLLLDRPIVFAPFDMTDYVKHQREFNYNYNDVTPGPKAKDWDEVLQYIEESLSDPDKYKSERERVRKIFHKYCDGHSSERVYREIIKLL